MSSAIDSAQILTDFMDRIIATRFAGNGLSRTAMVFRIATLGGVKLTVPMLNRIKDVNPRQLERVYDEVLRVGDAGNARFALRLILK